eukprot:2038373-Prymnesium_polylepis.2
MYSGGLAKGHRGRGGRISRRRLLAPRAAGGGRRAAAAAARGQPVQQARGVRVARRLALPAPRRALRRRRERRHAAHPPAARRRLAGR